LKKPSGVQKKRASEGGLEKEQVLPEEQSLPKKKNSESGRLRFVPGALTYHIKIIRKKSGAIGEEKKPSGREAKSAVSTRC